MIRHLCFLLWVLVATAAPTLVAQDPAVLATQDPAISVATLQARLDATKSDATVAADLKPTLVEVLGRALESAKATEALLQATQRYAEAAASAPGRLAALAAELQAMEAQKPGPPASDLKLADLEQGLLTAQKTQTDAQKQAAGLSQETARRSERRGAMPTLLGELKTRRDALPVQPAEAPGLDARLALARRLAVQAERLRLQTELDTLAAESASYDAEVEVLRTQQDLASRRATVAKADADAWLAVLQPLRAAEAQRAEREAQAIVLRADPRVVNLANGNAELAKEVAAVVEQRALAEREKADRDAERLRLQQDFDETKKRTALVGATDAVGALLRQRRIQLVETSRSNQQRTRSRRDRIADAQLKSLEFDEKRRRLVADPETWLQRELESGKDVADPLPDYVIVEARRLRDARRDLLLQLTESHGALLNTLVDVANTEHEFSALIARYRSYVTERVLGIRSSTPIWQTDWGAANQAAAWLTDGSHWYEVGHLWVAGMVADGWPFALLVPLLLLFGVRSCLRRRLLLHGEVALSGTNVAYRPTALAATDTALLALPLPALLWLFSWRLGAQPECPEFSKAVAAGSQHIANLLLLVTTVRCLLLPKGLAEAHFRWQTTTLSHMRRAQRVVLLMVPLAFLIAVLELPGEDRWLGSLGSIMLIAQIALLLVTFATLLHPTTGLVGGSVATAPRLLYRLSTLWYLLAVGMPATLLLMVVLGYDYTALQLARRIQWTVCALLVGVFVHAMILRGLVLERRRLQIRSTKERLAATKAGEAAGGAAELAAAAAPDAQSLARQTQTLLRGAIVIAVLIAAFQIWADVLPALSVLRRVELWSGGSDLAPVVVTLADLILSLFVLIAASVAASNLPAMLELLVLQRLHMQAGERHAISTLTRYIIVILGIVLAFSAIGIGWGKVQWLLAAISVGLGFGLQEVFANFVSGLILLFEQPMRVGDIVTVGTTTGKVTRIRIRATTIQDWDRKELIVPNRQFVTSEFVNWTLSDAVVRWVLPASIAVGSDTQLALRLLEEIAAESRWVLKDPRPEGVFVGFGDNNLRLELRLFVDMNTLDYRWMSDLNEAIARRFRDAGIEMTYQRDLNLKLSGPMAEFMKRGTPAAGSAPAPETTTTFPAARRTTDR